ncbi:calcium/sodium antiporter [Qipengyuania spongiae]|uniref:Calcium/sodium antiporter n=1 Tax=Qipengyuania spongiae TaxID=2909673 RepID=A0ABY5T1K4_9SPHN|nr:calcium/sodium antiporter [Qipengyuania spongiae]UVI40642.1 calcium/sodium antiporter [Qipengyuania spongiae]
MPTALLLTVAGLFALVLGGEVLVKGAVGIARKAQISSLLIGVVIVGLGTSMPELVTSIEAVLMGTPDLAWGNIVGSNIANALLILGVSALVAPIVLSGGRFMRDPMFGLIASFALLFVALGELGSPVVGVLMLVLLVGYLAYALRQEREPKRMEPGIADTPESGDDVAAGAPKSWTKPLLLTGGGLIALIVGGQMLVAGAIDLARFFGMSEALIGLTVVAVGTSFPELVTSVVAARRGEPEVAFGNVAGSNLFNLLLIGGITMVMAPEPFPRELVVFDLYLMVGAAAALAGLVFFVGQVSRRSGFLLLATYAGFAAFHIAAA